MGLLDTLIGSSPDSGGTEVTEGIVWSSFERKHEVWHFGPDDTKEVVYDGIHKDAVYRYTDGLEDARVTSYHRELGGGFEVVMYLGEDDPVWKEPVEDPETLYLVSEGKEGENLHFEGPVMVVTREVRDELSEHYDAANKRRAKNSPRGLPKLLRDRS